MFRFLGAEKRLCDGFSRRDLLQLGGLGMFGLTLADAMRLQGAPIEKTASGPKRGAAKSCILLFPFGSPPQHETFDPKPQAPAEIQGELKAISTSLPGVSIGEGLPRTAAIMDRLTVIRSMTHDYPVHGVAYALSGMPTYTPAIEADPRHRDHWPFVGSAVDFLDERQNLTATPVAGGRGAAVPRNIGLPWLFGSKSTVPTLAGPYASFLGQAHDPIWTDFDGAGTTVVPKLTDNQTEAVRDPFGGVLADSRFRLSGAGELPSDIPAARLDLRRSLLATFDRSRAAIEASAAGRSYDRISELAYSLLSANRLREALDVQAEPASGRERFGMNLFGQSCLVARRLVEAGGRFVSVFWDPFQPFGGSCWDTHANHFPRLKQYLLPVFDQAYSALILDLEQRGLLDETLVVCVSEHGRTPRIDSKPIGAGRHHWSRVYSAALAGGGTARGRVVGRSDAQGGEVAETPISPKDILATILHLLGIDPDSTVADPLGRPTRVAGTGEFRVELV